MIKIKYTILLKSAIRVASGTGWAGYIDHTIVRDGYGLAYIPGSTVKGKLRATAYRLAGALNLDVHPREQEPYGCTLAENEGFCRFCSIFGASQRPSGLHFGNAEMHPDLRNVLRDLDAQEKRKGNPRRIGQKFSRMVRTNVSIDRRSKTALAKRLFSGEVFEPQCAFSGEIRGLLPGHHSSIQGNLGLLVAAMQMVTHLGSARGRGLGRCQFVVDEVQVEGEVVDQSQLIEALFAEGGQS